MKEHLRRRYTGEPLEDDGEPQEAQALQDPGAPVIEQLSRDEFRRAIQDLLPEAPSDYQDLITAKFVMELQPEEIAQVLGWSMNKVYVTTFRALDWLKRRLRERYGPDVIRDWLA